MSESSLTGDDVKKLTAEFPEDKLGVKIQSLNRDKNKALLVLYLQHTDVMDRLEEADPAWKSEVINETRLGEMVYVRSRMTLKGVSRENVGEGNDPKAAYSDALKRCAMLFGVGRYLYDSIPVWVSYSDKDKYKQWTIEEYKAAAPKTSKPAQSTETKEASPLAPITNLSGQRVSHPQPVLSVPQIKRLWAIAKASQWRPEHVNGFILQVFKKQSPEDLSRQEYDTICDQMPSGSYETVMRKFLPAQQRKPEYNEHFDVDDIP